MDLYNLYFLKGYPLLFCGNSIETGDLLRHYGHPKNWSTCISEVELRDYEGWSYPFNDLEKLIFIVFPSVDYDITKYIPEHIEI